MRPDSWTEAVVVTSGRNYAQAGFCAHAGVPQFQPVTAANPSDPFFLYSTFPSGMYWINGCFQRAGITTVAVQRLLPILCSLMSLWFWFEFVRGTCGARIAALATVLMLTSFAFLGYADSLAYHAYTLFTVLLALVCFEKVIQSGATIRAGWVAAFSGSILATALLSHEYHFFLAIYFAGRLLVWGGLRKLGYLIIVIVPLLIAMAVQQWQRRTIIAEMPAGSVSGGAAPWADIYRRTIGFSSTIDTPPGLTLSGYPLWLAHRYFDLFGLPVIAVVFLFALIFWRRPGGTAMRGKLSPAGLCGLLLLAGSGWWLVMMQHTSVHAHTIRLGLMGYSLLLALGASHAWITWRSGTGVTRVVGAILTLAIIFVQADGLYAFGRNMVAEKYWDARERSDFGASESRALGKLKEMVPSDAIILTNHPRLAPMRLWSERPVYNGSMAFFPPGDAEHGRRFLEMSLLHLRELHSGELPRFYYVFWIYPSATFQDALRENELLRILMTGGPEFGSDGGVRSFLSLQSAIARGESSETFCPIRGVIPEAGILVFDFGPAVPVAMREWGKNPPPTLPEFGPAR